MKKEKSLLSSSSSSSSSYRERNAATAAAAATTPDGRRCLHSHSIGCMSGLFRLISRYQHRRKSLTYGKRQQKDILVSPPTKDGTADLVPALLREGDAGSRNEGPAAAKRISCEVPRSPTLPAEIRRSRSPESRAAPSPPQQPTVVARLMGLNSSGAPESAAEKRRKLLGALDECDRDLKALKKIIDVVRSAEELRPEQRGAVKPNASFDGRLQELAKKEGETDHEDGLGDNDSSNSGAEEHSSPPPSSPLGQQQQQPSPVSVLDEFSRSTLISGYTRRHSIAHQTRLSNYLVCDAERLVPPPQKKKPGEEFSHSICLLDRIAYEPSPVWARSGESLLSPSPPPKWVSEAMRQSVEQVCGDIAWGQRREVGRIGLALHDHICRDLIEETVREMGSWCVVSSLPFEACKRRLHF